MSNTNGNGEQLSIRITNREMYDIIMQLRDSVNSMDYRMSAILNENVTLNKRVRALEFRFYGVLGTLAAAMTALGIGLGVS